MESPTPRVAVLAVHGVADQQPNSTARRIVDLLLGLKKEGVDYGEFREVPLRVEVQGLHRPDKAIVQERAMQMDPRTPCLKAAHECGWPLRSAAGAIEELSSAESLEIKLMDEQVEGYEPSDRDAVYETVQLLGRRTVRQPNGQVQVTEVQVHEVYWADLSRASTTLARILIEFYQLLFYLCDLGRITLDFARARYGDKRPSWHRFGWLQLATTRSLVVIPPVLNLCLLALASSLVAYHLPATAHRPVLIAVGAVAGALLTGLAFYWRRLAGPPRRWPLGYVALLLTASAAAAVVAALTSGRALYDSLAIGVWIVAAILMIWLLRIYQRRQPGAFALGLAVFGVVTLIYLYALFNRSNSASGVLSAGFRSAEWTLILLSASWILYGLFALATSLVGAWATRSVSGEERSTALRVNWTVQLTLALPGLIMALINIVLWKMLYQLGDRFAGNFFFPREIYDPLPWLRDMLGVGQYSTVRAKEYAAAMVDAASSPPFAVGFLLAMLAALLAVWSILPAVLAESYRDVARTDVRSWLGECLSGAFRAMRISGEVLHALVIVGIPAAYGIAWLTYKQDWYREGQTAAAWGLGLFGSATLLAISGKGPFRWLALGFRSVLDIAMDVANWLRIHPKQETPRARISARFVSMLRALLDWRDTRDGHGYEAIVIIAHSQGTVIASEVLRYLQARQLFPSPSIPIYLFTMGCPLRQLYALRFPHQYAWACHRDDQWPGNKPDPGQLYGVKFWSNGYRSGDYVGRYLWFNDTGDARWKEKREGRDRKEFCFAAGAHNHYWDQTAPQIAEELDRLIVKRWEEQS